MTPERHVCKDFETALQRQATFRALDFRDFTTADFTSALFKISREIRILPGSFPHWKPQEYMKLSETPAHGCLTVYKMLDANIIVSIFNYYCGNHIINLLHLKGTPLDINFF